MWAPSGVFTCDWGSLGGLRPSQREGPDLISGETRPLDRLRPCRSPLRARLATASARRGHVHARTQPRSKCRSAQVDHEGWPCVVRDETGLSVRWNAIDPGFHLVLAARAAVLAVFACLKSDSWARPRRPPAASQAALGYDRMSSHRPGPGEDETGRPGCHKPGQAGHFATTTPS
jgi:hypothetical protein